jgi:hypothetical protein
MVDALPQLSPQDGRQLAAIFTHKRCLFSLARETGQPLHQLLHWAMLPHIQQTIEALSRLEYDAHRAAAIEALRHTMEKTQDLVEKRRAACAILRALNPAAPRPRVPSLAAHTTPPPAFAFEPPPPPPAAFDRPRGAVMQRTPFTSPPRPAADSACASSRCSKENSGRSIQVAPVDQQPERPHRQPETPPHRSAPMNDCSKRSVPACNQAPAARRPPKTPPSHTSTSRTPAALLARAGIRRTLDGTDILDTASLPAPITLTPDSS